jgi:hypothetical protein
MLRRYQIRYQIPGTAVGLGTVKDSTVYPWKVKDAAEGPVTIEGILGPRCRKGCCSNSVKEAAVGPPRDYSMSTSIKPIRF